MKSRNCGTNLKVHCVMQLSLSYKIASPEYHVIGSQLAGTPGYVTGYLCTLFLVSEFLAFANIKVFSHKYSQIIAASDWLHLFCTLGVFFSILINAHKQIFKLTLLDFKLDKIMIWCPVLLFTIFKAISKHLHIYSHIMKYTRNFYLYHTYCSCFQGYN